MSTVGLSFTMFYPNLLVEMYPESPEGIKIAAVIRARKWNRQQLHLPGADWASIDMIAKTLKEEIIRQLEAFPRIFTVMERAIKVMKLTKLLLTISGCNITKKHIDGFEVDAIAPESLCKINKTLKEHFNAELEMELLK